MSEYITKKEAVELFGKSRSRAYLDRYITKGEISTIPDPNDGRKKLLLVSDVLRIKAEKERKREEKAERKRIAEKENEEKKFNRFLDNSVMHMLKLDLIDLLSPYGITGKELYPFEDDVEVIVEMPSDKREKALRELCDRIKTHYDKRRRVS